MADSSRTYSEALTLLDTLQTNRAVVKMIQQSDRDMNLDATPEMLDWLRKAGYTVDDFKRLNVIHVAGTKGKGSVCAMAASILEQYNTGLDIGQQKPLDKVRPDGRLRLSCEAKTVGKIGLYTSPHLVTVRERIRICHQPISESLFASYFFTLWDRFSSYAAAAGHPYPTCPETKPGYFRYLTIMALHAFLQEGVKTAIIECGIGGEYDSTNILPKEAVTVTAITKLGIDHVGMLGNNIKEIAWHKGGIMKHCVKCFTVRQEPEAMRVLHERATEKGASLITVDRRDDINEEDVKVRLEGDFQKENASLAVAIVGEHLKQVGLGDVLHDGELPAKIRKGLEEVEWEGRCEVKRDGKIEWCIDGAHTLDSIKSTADWFATKLRGEDMGQAMLIFNQHDRDAVALVRALHFNLEQATGTRHIFSNAAFCSNTPFRSSNQRVSESNAVVDDLSMQRLLAGAWTDFESDTEIDVYTTIEDAVDKAREVCEDRQKLLVLVTGSLHLVGGFLKVLKKSSQVL